MYDAKLIFPKVRQVRLNRFSLYTLKPTNAVNISDGVFCLAGANGLGKSTFLAALNYVLTGIVPDPKREFASVKSYAELGVSFADLFFSGRVVERDREMATVSLMMDVGNYEYELTRAVFEPAELRALRVVDRTSGELVYDGTDEDQETGGTSRQLRYAALLTDHIGLKSFEQFIFLQHFLFTFDESRHLLLWDPKVLTQVLYLSIGRDADKASRADKLRRDVERAASRARNRNYAASNVRGRIEQLRDLISPTATDVAHDPERLEGEHKGLQDSGERAEAAAEARRRSLADVELMWLDATARLSALQSDFARAYTEAVRDASDLRLHPLVAGALSDSRCILCGTQAPEISTRVDKALREERCPFCDTHVGKHSTGLADFTERLRELDTMIMMTKGEVESALAERERLLREVAKSEAVRKQALAALREFEEKNDAVLTSLSIGNTGIAAAITRLQEEMDTLLAEKRHEYAIRDQKKRELLTLQHDLQKRYLEVQTQFVPKFQELAGLFLGMEVDIALNTTTAGDAPSLSLLLSLRGQARRQTYQLSESQRFFVDIALRMAMARFMTREDFGATLFIDTPEGSLDIAYESRAGEMFAEFVNDGQSIVMTANVNTSQLLRRLAKRCGRDRMTVLRMMSWTELSDVQLEESALFEEAYAAIEAALDQADVETERTRT